MKVIHREWNIDEKRNWARRDKAVITIVYDAAFDTKINIFFRCRSSFALGTDFTILWIVSHWTFLFREKSVYHNKIWNQWDIGILFGRYKILFFNCTSLNIYISATFVLNSFFHAIHRELERSPVREIHFTFLMNIYMTINAWNLAQVVFSFKRSLPWIVGGNWMGDSHEEIC